MILINIDPVILVLGSFELKWDLVAALGAGFAAIVFFVIDAGKFRLRIVHIVALCVLVILFGIIGARLLSLIELIIYHGDFGSVIGPGLRMYGLIFGSVAIVFFYARVARLNFWKIVDTGIIPVIIFMVLYRIGCVLVGCCFGTPSDLPWAVIYMHPATYAPREISIHPTQLYHLIWALLTLFILYSIRKRFHKSGILMLLGNTLLLTGDFVIRFFRGDEPSIVGNLSLSQILALLIIGFAIGFIIIRLKITNTKYI